MPHSPAPIAAVGGSVASELLDVTSDLSALDSTGYWVVMLPFEGTPLCARFGQRRPMTGKPARHWIGPSPEAWTTNLDQQSFCKRVEIIRAAIAVGDVYQVNLTRRLSAPLPPDADILALTRALAGGNPSPYAAVIRLPDHGIHVASASPERFLQRSGQMVLSQPIKGTAATPDGFLDKDRAENVMIVDLVRNDLGRVCEWGSIQVPDLCVPEEHPGLIHLVSTIRGRLRADVGWPELIGATFPPGSVTGAPKVAALSMIEKLETLPRGPYCGAIGWVDADNKLGDLNVAIRTFWFDEGQVHLGTGGAITWGSDPIGEWEETELKTNRLLHVASNQLLTITGRESS